MISVQVKACRACAAAKRRCGKQLPTCDRCAKLGFGCAYPPLGHRRAISSATQSSRSPSNTEPSIGGLSQDREATLQPSLDDGTASLAVPSSPSILSPDTLPAGHVTSSSFESSLAALHSAWFLTPQTWEVVKLDTIPNRPTTPELLEEYISVVEGWLTDWSANGHNSFVHRQLYISHIPEVISDAFTTLTSYIHKSAATQDLVFRIMEMRISSLIGSGKVDSHSTMSLTDNHNPLGEPTSVLGHLSRVQALTIYTFIGLFRGDIRQRHIAERNLPLLVSWCHKMLQAATHEASNGHLLYSEASRVLGSRTNATRESPQQKSLTAIWQHMDVAEQEATLWHSWIIAESVRRTWLTARSIESVYILLRDRMGVCPGGLPFTTRKGLWDANSAFAWVELCAQSDAGFMHIWETEKLCTLPTSETLDEFAKATIRINFRTERTKRWVDWQGDGQ